MEDRHGRGDRRVGAGRSRVTPLGRKLPPDSYHYLRYEDLLVDPRAELTSLCRFLDEPFEEIMLDHAAAAQDIVPTRKTWHDLTRGALDTTRVDAWRSVLTPIEVGLLELVGGRTLRRNGYVASGVGARPSAAELLAYYKDRNRRMAGIYKVRLDDLRKRRGETQPLAYQG